MKILTAQQIKEIDQYTILNKPIPSIDLMEKAAESIFEMLAGAFNPKTQFALFCGNGNNGGDGLALARILASNEFECTVYLVTMGTSKSEDNLENLKRLRHFKVDVWEVSVDNFPKLGYDVVVIDAILGTGVSRPISGELGQIIKLINELPNYTIAIDMPSGLFDDRMNGENDIIIKANDTIAFQLPKLAFFLSQNEKYVGDWYLTDIGLLQEGIDRQQTQNFALEMDDIKSVHSPRMKYSHKGSHGHSLLIGGSYGRIGAILLSALSAMRSGSGLVTTYVPQCGYQILQTQAMESLCMSDPDEKVITAFPASEGYDAIGIGPGMGQHEKTSREFIKFLKSLDDSTNLILDADALNILSAQKELLRDLPKNTILTPHPKEFQRLVGQWENDYEKLDILRAFSQEYNVVVVLKGAHTAIATPDGNIYFNTTGNPGMAKGGSGDVLTGIITALLAQGYKTDSAAKVGVYLHGLAADLAVKKMGYESLLSRDVLNKLGAAFFKIKS